MKNELLVPWRHRRLICEFALHDLCARYAGSAMGLAWYLLNPLLQVLIYTFVFCTLLEARFALREGGPKGFALFLCSGLLPWICFSETLTRGTKALVANANLIKKTNLPTALFLYQLVISRTISFLIAYAVFLGVFSLLGYPARLTAVQAVPIALLQQVFAFSLIMALSCLNVFFRDVSELVTLAVRLWWWLTPIIYPLSIIPKEYRFYMKLNPVAHFIGGYRTAVVNNDWLSAAEWGWLAALSLVAFIPAVLFFSHVERDCRENV